MRGIKLLIAFGITIFCLLFLFVEIELTALNKRVEIAEKTVVKLCSELDLAKLENEQRINESEKRCERMTDTCIKILSEKKW